ncbi:MAG TPA: transcriptional regulator [Ignavibacteriales bacterium]|nr:transcriptional regulator [Ignavibacteriales bacterium]
MSTSNNRHIPEELNNAINMIGDAWILCIISNLGNSSMRFNEIQRSISGINPTTLADRLKKLEKEQIVIRKEETLDKISVVYELTKKGRGILPIINEIAKFADKYYKSELKSG